jgi:hypothetical protein
VPSGGIAVLDAPGFSLHCYETPTGVKFFVTAPPRTPDVGGFLRKVYEFYADFVLKVGAPLPGARAVSEALLYSAVWYCGAATAALLGHRSLLTVIRVAPPTTPAEPVLRAGHAHPREAV